MSIMAEKRSRLDQGARHLTGDDIRAFPHHGIPAVPPRGADAHKAIAWQLGIKYGSAKELYVLSVNRDPYYQGSEAHVRDAEWFADLWERFGFTSGVHIRRIHYRMVHGGASFRLPDGEEYENTEACYRKLSDASRSARILGLVDAEAFVDRRNRAVAEYLPPRVSPCNRPGFGGTTGPDFTCQNLILTSSAPSSRSTRRSRLATTTRPLISRS